MTTNVVSNLTSPDSGKAPLEKQEIIRPSFSSSSCSHYCGTGVSPSVQYKHLQLNNCLRITRQEPSVSSARGIITIEMVNQSSLTAERQTDAI